MSHDRADSLLARADTPAKSTPTTASNELKRLRLVATAGKPLTLNEVAQCLAVPYATAKTTMSPFAHRGLVPLQLLQGCRFASASMAPTSSSRSNWLPSHA